MARPYSKDLRDRVVGSVASGRTCRATAALFGVSVASVVKWSQRFRATGSAAAKKMGGWRPLLLKSERDWLLARLAEKPALTFLAALRCDRITAPCVMDGPINGISFRTYVEQFLAPTLTAGDIVIMDNLGSHKGQAVRRLIRAAGAKLFFLPRYSPDLNPIEQVFAKLKTLLRKTDPRTTETTWRGIGDLLDRFTPQECANYLANAGYAST